MDPLSITVAAVTLTTRCSAAAVDIYNAWEKWKDAPATVGELAEETTVIAVTLKRVEKTIRDDPGVLARSDLGDVFAVAVKGCRATLMCLEEEYDNLMKHSQWWMRLKALWKDADMKRLLELLGRKKVSLMLLIQSLQM